MFVKMWKLTVVISCAALSVASSQTEPQKSPCPDIFQYAVDGEKWYGVITVSNPTYAAETTMHVTSSLAAKLPTKYAGSLELAESNEDMLRKIFRGLPIIYFVNFPIHRPIPKITGISYNGALICRGPPESFRSGVDAITSLSLDHTFITGGYSVMRETIPPVPVNENGIYNADQTVPPNYYNQPNGNRKTKPPRNSGQDSHSKFPLANNIPLPSRLVETSTFDGADDNRLSSSYQDPFENTLQTGSLSPPESSMVAELDDFECGISHFIDNRIVNGYRTSKGNWPWITAMYIRRVDFLAFHCSGTLISSRHIVTAAQCMYDPRTKNPFKVNNLLARLGLFNLQDWSDEDTRQMEISKFVIHPDFNRKTFQCDIALQTLANQATFTDYIIPVCLWNYDDSGEVDGQIGTVIGWGRDENGSRSVEPRMASMPLISVEKCRANSDKLFNLVNNMTICAGGRDGSGPCNGDAGAGVYSERGQKWHLRGLVSLSLSDRRGVCDLGDYVILTDGAWFAPWMLSHMAEK